MRRRIRRHLRLLLDQPCFCRIGEDGKPSRLCNFHNRQELRIQEMQRALEDHRCRTCFGDHPANFLLVPDPADSDWANYVKVPRKSSR